MRISDWSSDVCSSDLLRERKWPSGPGAHPGPRRLRPRRRCRVDSEEGSMDQTAQIALGAAGADASGMRIWHLFLAADWIVKSVMGILLIASVAGWADLFDKWLKIRARRGSAQL